MRVLFMGTPDFAVPTLSALCDSGYEIVGVVTQPDKPRGRGHHLMPPPVKEFAMSKGLEVYQPLSLKGEEFYSLLCELDPEVIVVVAYGKILPINVLEYPKYKCINVHGSLLPEYRGAAPMQRAIIDGKAETGITTMLMAAGLDTGDMLLKESFEIGIDDNFEDVHDGLSDLGASLLIKTLKEFKLTIKGFRPIEEAIITSGGVKTSEINPKTMESKFVQGLYFAGEVIDVSAYTGGFNLQIAFSTGHLAGSCC